MTNEADQTEVGSPVIAGSRKRPMVTSVEKTLSLDQAIIQSIECCRKYICNENQLS
jgi:endonuclease V-like protein UPF0215 family